MMVLLKDVVFSGLYSLRRVFIFEGNSKVFRIADFNWERGQAQERSQAFKKREKSSFENLTSPNDYQ
jgi:hypothetical protein